MIWTGRAFRSGWILGALLISAGCGMGGSAHPADPDQAREALIAVLDAWKAGEKPEDLGNRTPPIHVKDTDWKGGFVLVSYNAQTEGKLAGYDMNCPVSLELKSPKGKSAKKTVIYTITTRPELLVTRQEG